MDNVMATTVEDIEAKVDASDLTDESVLKILIERGRATIIRERASAIRDRQSHADAIAEDQRIKDYIHKYGTDEG